MFPLVFVCSKFFFVYAVHLFLETKLLNQTGIAALLSCLSCNILLYSSFFNKISVKWDTGLRRNALFLTDMETNE